MGTTSIPLTEPGLVRSESRSDLTVSDLGAGGTWAYVRMSSSVSVTVSAPLSRLDSEVKLMSAGRKDSDIRCPGDLAGLVKKFGWRARLKVVVRILCGMDDVSADEVIFIVCDTGRFSGVLLRSALSVCEEVDGIVAVVKLL